MDDDDDDDHLSTIDLTPSETDTSATDEYNLSHDEDDHSLAALNAANEETTAEAAASSSTSGPNQVNSSDVPGDEVEDPGNGDGDGDNSDSSDSDEDEDPGQDGNQNRDQDGGQDGSQHGDQDEDGVSFDFDYEYSPTDSEAESRQVFSHALPEYRIRWATLHQKARLRKHRIRDLEAIIGRHESDERERERLLRDGIVRRAQPNQSNERRTQATWPSLIRQGQVEWERIYKISCKEGNASPVLKKIHPDLNLRKPTRAELQADLLRREMPRSSNIPADNTPGSDMLRSDTPRKQIPGDIQFKILRCLLEFQGKVVHAISRLDPYHPASAVPMNRYQRPSFFHRLHVGRAPVNITFAPNPNVFLAPLLGRFAKGIRANVQRLQHIEILWIGSQHLTFAINDRGKYTSRRTFSLVWLPEAIRLKTIGVYLPESSEMYMRRNHEPRGINHHMKCKSKLQPNFRGFRSLRTVQGMDYVYCLRGLDQIEFWDFDRWLDTQQRKQPVRDWHFIMDVNNAVRRPKDVKNRSRSQLRNLFPLLNSFIPSEEDWAVLLRGLGSHEAEGPQGSRPESPEAETSIVTGDTSPESSSDTDSDADSDSDSDSSPGSDSGPGPGPDLNLGSDSDSDSSSSSSDDDDDYSPLQLIPLPNLGANLPSQPASQPNLSVNYPLQPVSQPSLSVNSSSQPVSQPASQPNLGANPSSQPASQSNLGVNSVSAEENSLPHTESSQPSNMLFNFEMLRIAIQDSDDESTIVPDDRSVSGHPLLDLTEDEDDQPNQEYSQDTAPSAQSSTNDNPEGSLFVSDDGYNPSYTPSLTRNTPGDRGPGDDWEGNSDDSPPKSTEGSEESEENSRKRDHLKIEEEDGDGDGGGGSAPVSAKRPRT
ncbi:uncharacterized protein TRIVIDRAFT_63893 [Trichoderma virens Gv29-8]|uniref:Uncharacterized protein n=1 Tax=Hypocrea virens (strain Gv29-8 / FGSC 10586) TaxID=413071 RepID=G9MP87_HYPVG|nr:uncharacterized protein TRIVIDRAFT_63893 [Trichoderma virens Gv29-8]EHK23689.1 hypothetical protein TRIVIDRAFT_63893 [Trichoderma virens Gv29-8]